MLSTHLVAYAQMCFTLLPSSPSHPGTPGLSVREESARAAPHSHSAGARRQAWGTAAPPECGAAAFVRAGAGKRLGTHLDLRNFSALSP